MAYVDGYVLAVSKNKVEDYRKIASMAGQVWKEYGALSYVECVADDVPKGELTSFPRAVMAKDDETVIFAFITYNSRQERDVINAKVMRDPRMQLDQASSPFDMKRMIFGGFEPIVQY